MIAIRIACTIGVLLAASACSTPNAQELVPALIIDPTPESRAELLRVVRDALHGASVTLAEDALTRDSLLIIERNAQGDLEGKPLTGRELGKPEQFRLMISGSHCLLVRLSDGERWELNETRCVAE